jgi:hypothetical protein
MPCADTGELAPTNAATAATTRTNRFVIITSPSSRLQDNCHVGPSVGPGVRAGRTGRWPELKFRPHIAARAVSHFNASRGFHISGEPIVTIWTPESQSGGR